MTTFIDMTEQAFSSLTSAGHVAITASDIQSRTVETNSRTCYDRRMFRGSSTNPKVVVWHPDEWGFDDSKPTRLFLQLIDKEIVNNPDALIPADEAQIKRLKQLLKDVEV